MWHKNWSQNLKEVAGRIVRDGFGQLVFIFVLRKRIYWIFLIDTWRYFIWLFSFIIVTVVDSLIW